MQSYGRHSTVDMLLTAPGKSNPRAGSASPGARYSPLKLNGMEKWKIVGQKLLEIVIHF